MKWAVIFTLPSGARFAASVVDGKFALVPIENGRFKQAMGFNSPKEAADWLQSFLAVQTQEDRDNLMKLSPKIRRCIAEKGPITAKSPGTIAKH